MPLIRLYFDGISSDTLSYVLMLIGHTTYPNAQCARYSFIWLFGWIESSIIMFTFAAYPPPHSNKNKPYWVRTKEQIFWKLQLILAIAVYSDKAIFYLKENWSFPGCMWCNSAIVIKCTLICMLSIHKILHALCTLNGKLDVVLSTTCESSLASWRAKERKGSSWKFIDLSGWHIH